MTVTIEANPVRYAEDTKPDMEGPHGRAWKNDIEAMARRYPDGPPASTTVASWIVEAPWAHPAWHSYMIACVHLRDTPGMDPPKIYRQGATHEIFVIALNPRHKRAIDDYAKMLTPVNFAAQFVQAGGDESARDRIAATVREILDGKLSPDTDFRRQWVARFGDSNRKPETVGLPDEGAIVIVGDTALVVGTGASVLRALTEEAGKPDPKEMH